MISESPPKTLLAGSTKGFKKKKEKVKTLFDTLTESPLTTEETEKLRLKAMKLTRRLLSKAPQDRDQNMMLLRQMIYYLALEFKKVKLLMVFGIS